MTGLDIGPLRGRSSIMAQRTRRVPLPGLFGDFHAKALMVWITAREVAI
jgi:hypothetical protein